MKNNDFNKKAISRKKRGEISKEDLANYEKLTIKELIILLNDENSQKRTIAATLLKNKNTKNNKLAIKSLAKAFKIEKALYTRLAISDSLASYGEEAIPYLIDLLGKIGNNQEKELPKKYFDKKSFPLPRDLAARTLAKMGNTPTPFLIELLEDYSDNYSNFVKEQAVDAIGAIAYKNNDYRALYSLQDLFLVVNSKNLNIFNINDNLTVIWKIVRSLSGFKKEKNALKLVIKILESYKDYSEIQWEAIRSIGQIGILNKDVKLIFKNYENNSNSQIKLALSVSKEILELL